MPKLLITTKLEINQINGREAILLGEWCKPYGCESINSQADCEVLPFHWDAPGKRDSDYQYLNNLYAKVLAKVVQSLNACHNLSHPIRYWEILVGTWLMSYVSCLFDRWESLRQAFDSCDNFDFIVINSEKDQRLAFGSFEYVAQCFDDQYNHNLFREIIQFKYPSQCTFIAVELESKVTAKSVENVVGNNKSKIFNLTYFKDSVKKIFFRLVELATKLQPCPDVVFINSFFRPTALFRLHLLIGQLPRSYPVFREFRNHPNGTRTKNNSGFSEARSQFEKLLRVNVSESKEFESFLYQRMITDLPRAYLEGFGDLKDCALNLELQCKVIVTANAHWHNELFKMWAAERTLHGTKLIISEHGGSFPAKQYIFNLEENISDTYVPTFLEHHPKHVLLPPSKYVGARPTLVFKRSYLTIVTYDTSCYTVRASSQPHSKQVLDCFNDCVKFCNMLPDRISCFLRIKTPHYSRQYSGWELRSRYVKQLGENFVLGNMSLKRAFRYSKIILCTYPQSTFTEAMLSGIPTILFFDPRIHGVHSIADDCLKKLFDAGIVFFDPGKAAEQVSRIWENPKEWWNSVHVKEARNYFMESTMNDQPNPLMKWSSFLKNLINTSDDSV